jgi:hypothetical protein
MSGSNLFARSGAISVPPATRVNATKSKGFTGMVQRAGGDVSQLAWAVMLIVVLGVLLALGITLINALYRHK